MKKVFMTKRGVFIYSICITHKTIKTDTKRVARLEFSGIGIILESLEDNEPGDDELLFSWGSAYAAIAKN